MMRRSSVAVTSEERRGLTVAEAGCEVREDAAAGKRFAGHAAVFDTRTAIGNPLTFGFYEEVAAGAFTKTLSEGDARMLIDHDPFYVVSRVSAGTLGLAQDRVGLAVDSALDPELSYVRDLTANLRNGNVTGMSFGFFVVKDDWQVEKVQTSDGQEAEVEVRTILETKLIEVSAVTFPAYDATDAGLRSQVVAALRCRGDRDAVARRAAEHPQRAEFAALLEELPAPTVIDLAAGSVTADKIEANAVDVATIVRGEHDGPDTVVDVTGQEPITDNEPHPEAPDMDERGEPAETTRDESTTADGDTAGEPGETTHLNAPSLAELNAAVRLRIRAYIS